MSGERPHSHLPTVDPQTRFVIVSTDGQKLLDVLVKTGDTFWIDPDRPPLSMSDLRKYSNVQSLQKLK